MKPITESVVLTAIKSCLVTADHYIGKRDRRNAEWWLDRADSYATRLILCRQIGELVHQRHTARPFAQ